MVDINMLSEEAQELLKFVPPAKVNTEIIDESVPVINKEITVPEPEIDNEQFLSETYGISLSAMKEGNKLKQERLVEGQDAYYDEVFTNFIQPNKMLVDQISKKAIQLTQEKYGESGTQGYADHNATKEATRMLIDKLYDTNIDIRNSYANYQMMIDETTTGKEAMLLGGISSDYAMNIKPRFIVELVGPSAPKEVKLDLLKSVLKNFNPNVNPIDIKVGTFAELSPTYKGKNGDMLAYRIGNKNVQPVNVPGADMGDIAMFLRELPGVAASITAGIVASPGGIIASAGSAGVAAALSELVTQSFGYAYSLQASDGDVDITKLSELMAENWGAIAKDVALVGGLEATLGAAIPGLARLIKKAASRATGNLPPNAMIKAYDVFKKAGGKVDTAAVDRVNKILLEELGEGAPQVDISILQAFKSGAIPITKDATTKLATPTQITELDLAQTKIIKETSDAFVKLSTETIDQGFDTSLKFTASPKLLFGNNFKAAAANITKENLSENSSLFINPYNKLDAILNSMVESGVLKGVDGAVFDSKFITQSANKYLVESIQKGNTKIANIFNDAGLKLDTPFIRPNEYRTQAYQLKKILESSFFKNMDQGQKEALEGIIKDVSIFTKGTPGQGKIKDLSYNQVDQLLNDLNDIIDNPNLFGALAKKNKVVLLAGKLREDMYGGIRKQFNNKHGKVGGEEKFNQWLNIRSELKALSDFKSSDLLRKVLNVNDIGSVNTGSNLWTSLINTANGTKQLNQMGYLFNKMPGLDGQKQLFKESILDNLRKTLNGPTGDGLEMASKNKDFTSVNAAYKKWLNKEGATARQFFNEAEWKKISNGGLSAVKELENLTKKKVEMAGFLKEYTNITAWDSQAIYGQFKEAPELMGKFFKEGVERKLLNKEQIDAFKKYSAMQFNNKTMVQAGEGVFIFDPKALRTEITNSPDFYRELFGEKWLGQAEEITKFLDQYYSPVINSIRSGGDSNVTDKLKNVFFGQLDRKRTLIKGFVGLFNMIDNRRFVNFYNFKEFKAAYKNAHLSTTAMNLSQVLESSASAYYRANDEARGNVTQPVANASIITGATVGNLGAAVVEKGAGIINNLGN